MRIYSDCYELMSEMGRNLWEMGTIVKPKSYQNKNIEGDEDFITKELISAQYCLTSLDQEEVLFVFDKNSIEWTRAELQERISNPVNPGEAYKIRKDLWEQFLNEKGEFDYNYSERIFHDGNIYSILEELKRNPDTRQAILPIFSPNDVQYIGGKRRVPCSMYYDFLIRENAVGERVLHINYHQRSCDYVTHFGNDVWLAFNLMKTIANYLEIKPGYLYHTIDSMHSYKKDWIKLKTPISLS